MTNPNHRVSPLIALLSAVSFLALLGSCSSKATGSHAPRNQSCAAQPGGPAGVAPLPSGDQLAYQRTEMTAFIHFGMATFDGTEQGNLSVDLPSLFNPTNLDGATVKDWVSALKAAGFRQAMLVAKHSTGFCLWPTATTEYSVKNSPWMNGQGDVVKLFTDAMHEAGMRVALYLAPWDQTYPSSKDDYGDFFKQQLTELLTNYGTISEIEFDGFNAPTTNVDWKSVFQLARDLQPNILVWAGPEIVNTGATPDLEWIGNENGSANRKTSSLDTHNCGGGSKWCPYECNVSIRRPQWFWHPNGKPMDLSAMQSIYFETVGMNCTLIFNVPPATTGGFDPADVALLNEFGAWYATLYQRDLLQGQPVTADSTWDQAGFDATKAVDGDVCTYWAAADGATTARLEVTPKAGSSFNVLSISEPIELGERVTGYHVELKQDGVWGPALSTTGARIVGTVIGQRQLWQLGSTTAEAVALVIDSAKDVPAIAELSAMDVAGASGDGGTPITGTDGTLCPTPAAPLITDFTYTGDGTTGTGEVHFGSGYGVLAGGEYVYPTTGAAPLTPDVTQSNWHITGTVGDYSGFGLYFDNCNRLDASQYKGLSFKISGTLGETAGQPNVLTMNVGTLNDTLAPAWINTHGGDSTSPGRCIPTSGTSQYAQEGCASPRATITVTDTPTVVNLLWTDFSGGSPEPTVATPAEITSISWTFPWAGGGTPYPVDLVIDDLAFIP